MNIGFMPIDDPGSQMDVLPTIMHFLGGSSAVPEGLDGQVFAFKDYARTSPSSTTDTSTCGTDSVLQADYRGTVNVTANGVACQAWDSQEPHSHSLTPCNYPDAGLESNYCRNRKFTLCLILCYCCVCSTRHSPSSHKLSYFPKPMVSQMEHGVILMTPTRDGIIVMYLVVELRYDEYEFIC